ncbi:MAG TPA: MFS transporter [Candidatus Acidoferrum sp.]|jgi:ACS family hexuronate transporter-like MFS transporter
MNSIRHSNSSSVASVKGIIFAHFRWVICAVLFFGMTKNYMDRQVLAVLKINLQHQFGWNEIQYGHLVFAFQTAYALGMLVVGRFIDRLGTRVGYAVTIGFWSLASVAHGLMNSLGGFLVARFALGFGESGVFPASLKAVAEWFPKKERALATGIFNAGTNVGAALTPLLVPLIYVRWGWRGCFFAVGALGFVGLALWLWLYRPPEEHQQCSAEELRHIRSDGTESAGKFNLREILRHRQTWAFVSGKFLIDPIWWFYLFWIPDFLERRHGLSLRQIGLPILVIYVLADFGSVAGGWLSSFLLHRGKTVNLARKTALLVCAICVVPIIFAARVNSVWAAVLLIGLAAAAHQGFSTNLLTLPSDMFPARVVASVAGLGGAAGAFGGMLIAEVVAHILQWTGSYTIPFFIAGSAYLLALAVMQLLAPKLEAVRIVIPPTA